LTNYGIKIQNFKEREETLIFGYF